MDFFKSSESFALRFHPEVEQHELDVALLKSLQPSLERVVVVEIEMQFARLRDHAPEKLSLRVFVFDEKNFDRGV